MNESTSYTPEEVAKILKISRYTVYEMIKRGDLAAYRIGRKVRVEAPDLDHYIKNAKDISPSRQPANPPTDPLATNREGLIICGQDVILDILTRHMERSMPHIRFLRNYVGSIDGLMSLYRGTADAATAHLWDSDSNSYNVPYIRRLLPGHHTVIINLAYRTAGFYVAKGNPKSILDWQDLSKPDVRFVNRERGSGARVLLDEKLQILSVDHATIAGYNHEEMSHFAVASVVARGEADVGLGIERAALQIKELDFIPLQQERYDLVIRKEDTAKQEFQALLSAIRSKGFKNEIQGMGGYELRQTGEIIAET
ncbi:MAG: metal-binding protein [Anaerosporomusa subterranea]|jgi:putative molybdopterin biosynthesis protein|nr:metal-binding protein [Anaerosporomusa subterranea]